jgi:carbon storage regulator CsrA
MLVLSRKMGQELVIGDNIRIAVSRIAGNRVTLGISAPNDVRIVRGELEPIVRSFEVGFELDTQEAGLPSVGEPASVAAPWVAGESSSLSDLSRQVH